MPDNIDVNRGIGDTVPVAADEVAGVLHQRAKMQFGEDGTATDVSATNPMPVVSADALFEVVPTLDTAAYAAGDVLFAATEVASVALAAGRAVWLSSLQVVDVNDQKQGFYLHLFDRTVTFGTFNAAPSISDADAAFYMGTVGVFVSNYHDLGGAAVATAEFAPILLKPNATSVYIAAIAQGAATYAASGLRLKLGFVRA